MTDTRNGVLSVIGASFLYGIMPVFTKRVLLEGLSSNALVFNRFFFTAVFALIICILAKISLRVSKRQLVELIFAAVIGYGLTASLLTVSYSLIPVGLATMLHFTNPLFVTLAMILLFREKPTFFKMVSCIFAVIGLVLMADFSAMAPKGVIFATLSGMTYAFYVILNKKGSIAELNNFVIIFYVGTINSIFFGIRNMAIGDFHFPPNLLSFVLMAVIALFCTICALYLLTYGIRTLGASTAAVLNMIEPIVSLFAGMIVYHDRVGLKSLFGCRFIVASGIVVVLDRTKSTEG